MAHYDAFDRTEVYLGRVEHGYDTENPYDPAGNAELDEYDWDREPNLVTSRLPGGESHRPIFDLDFPCRLIESASGNHHLYMDGIKLSTEDWAEVLEVFERVGIVQKGWVDTFRRDGFVALRKPGVKKPKNEAKPDFIDGVW